LSAAIAHEVRNPLQGIALTLANLKEHLKPGAEPYVAVMFSEMDRLNALVGGILTFARPVPPQPAPAVLDELCARAVDLASDRASQRGVRIELAPGAAGECEVDPGQILQVILNLLLNAVDASPPGSSVVVRVEPAARGGDDAWDGGTSVVVQDHGTGIADDVRDKLFDPFFTTKPEGTGLGLAVSLQIVEEHGGTIQVENTPGGGATFRVELPVRGAVVRDRVDASQMGA
jgi:two-component system sensor histidine kinase HydH